MSREGSERAGSAWDLDELVAALRKARHGHTERSAQSERCERPSRDALLEIVRALRAALFPTHFGVSDFTESSVDFFIGHTLEIALSALAEQVRRGLLYTHGSAELARAGAAVHARELAHAFAQRLPAVRAALETDIQAAYRGDPAATSRAEVLFCYPGVSAITHHRLAHELYRLGVPLLARMISETAHASTGIDIHPGARIGEEFFIDHGTGVVIGETAVIGRQVRLYQGVTLGARSFPVDADGAPIKGAPRHPIIEDDVVIYSGASVLGRITVGRGSVIGGNVWLTRSVPPGSRITQARTQRGEVLEDGAGI